MMKVTDLDKLYNQVLKNDLVFTPRILIGLVTKVQSYVTKMG